MARKKPEKKAPEPKLPSISKRVIAVARRLVTVPPESIVWSTSTVSLNEVLEVSGAIVRLRAPPDADDDNVERVRSAYQNAGAARVTLLPRPRKELLPEERPQSVVEARSAREVVESLVEESTSDSKEVLRHLCVKVMDEEGL